MRVLVLGFSHVGAIRNALTRQPFRGDIELLQLKLPEFSPNIDEQGQINANIVERVDASVASGVDLIVSALGNNRHNTLGLVKHQRPFDFVCETEPNLPLQDDHELVPQPLIRARLVSEIGDRAAILLRMLRDRSVAPIVHLETPPPVEDETFLTTNAGPFRKWVDARGLTHPLVRYKLWREASAIYQQTCQSLDIRVLPPPRHTQNRQKFLLTKYASGATHGNLYYGMKVLDQIVKDASPSLGR